jgi:two-component system NtrC family sensor kinase
MIKFKLSLNQKLIGITIAAFVIIIGLGSIKEYENLKRESLSYRKASIISLSDNIHNSISSLMLQGKCSEISSLFKNMSRRTSVELLRVFNPGNRVITASPEDADVGKKLEETDYDWYLKHDNGEPFLVTENKIQHYVRFLPIQNITACYKCHPPSQPVLGVIEIKMSLAKVFLLVRRMVVDNIIFAALSIILFSLVFSYIVIKLIHEPLDEIIETIKSVEDGNFDKQVTVKRDDVIGKLAEKFNNMTGKISESRREVEKYHIEQMKRASQMAMIGEIASGIAHEIKNPLACISAALQVIDGNLEEKDEHKMIIQDVVSQVKRLDGTVKRILEFAKPVKTQKMLMSIDEVLKETISFIGQLANNKSVSINLAEVEGIKKVYADGKALRQVFLNICLNAIEAMQDKGILHIAAAMVHKEGVEGVKEYVEIRIQDTGIGISEEILTDIFNPFFTTKARGTGLGLSISAQIVEEHGGFIEVDSKMGQGTTFMVYIPAVNECG